MIDPSALPLYQSTTAPALYAYASLVETLVDNYEYAATAIAASGVSLDVLARIYHAVDPYFITAVGAASSMALCWLASVLTAHYSFVDRLWSILPPLYALHYLLHAAYIHGSLWANPRLALVVLLIVAWGIRLTFNYWRKGGYRWGEQDYRWSVVRASMPRWAFQPFNLLFIAIYQLWLLSALTAPVYICWRAGFAHWCAMDIAATLLFVAALLGETVADEQQWRFHQRKQSFEAPAKRYRRKSNDPVAVVDADVRNGFLTGGLWRYSRHPNFFCEQAIWLAVYMFGTAATGAWLRWDGAAVVTLILLFQGSTTLTEQITASKYPAYAAYQRTTSRLMPWWPRKMAPHKEHAQ